MFLTLMGWSLVTFSLCPPVWSGMKVLQPYRVTSLGGAAQLQCLLHHGPSFPEPEEVRVTLLRGLHGSQRLCSTTHNFTEPRESGVGAEGQKVQCSAEVTGGAVQVMVSGLTAADTDMYRCEVEVLYPPPYLRLTGNGTLIHVPDICDLPVQEMVQQSEEEEEEGKEPLSAPVVVLVILVLFVLFIIIYFQTVQCERGQRTDSVLPGGRC